MTEYYGQTGTGKPFPPDSTYFAWSPEEHKGWWVTTDGRWHQFSRFTMDMSVPQRWTRVTPYTIDRDFDMDEGL